MKPKLILCLALVLSGGLFGCSTVSHRSLPSYESELQYWRQLPYPRIEKLMDEPDSLWICQDYYGICANRTSWRLADPSDCISSTIWTNGHCSHHWKNVIPRWNIIRIFFVIKRPLLFGGINYPQIIDAPILWIRIVTMKILKR
jgi:hypothetical protein